MRRFFIFTVLLLIATSALMAQTIDLQAIGIKSLGRNGEVLPGTTIEVNYKYKKMSLPPRAKVVGPALEDDDTNGLNMLYINWYLDENPDLNGLGDDWDELEVVPFNNANETPEDVDGYHFNTVQFALPNFLEGIKSFSISSILYAKNNSNYYYSNEKESSNGITGYSGYLTLDTRKPPVAESVIISNPNYAKLGQTLTASYILKVGENIITGFTGLNGEWEKGNDDQSTYKWLRSDSQNGTYTAISGATSLSYEITDDDVDYYLKFEVTPKASTGAGTGVAVICNNPSPMVQGRPIIAIISTSTALPLQESSANNGSLSNNTNVSVILNNAEFINLLDPSKFTLNNLPVGLTITDLQRDSDNHKRMTFKIGGQATYHEFAAFMEDQYVDIEIDKSQMKGVENNLEYEDAIQIEFKNNPVQNLAVDSVSLNWVKLKWSAPAGLLNSGSGINGFQIWKNDAYTGKSLSYNSSITEYSYTLTGVEPGACASYKVKAMYSHGDDVMTSESVKATPLGFASYSIVNPAVNGIIDHDNKMVTLSVPAETDLSNLVASFTVPDNVTVLIDNTTQTSGSTLNNYSKPLVYSFAIDTCSTIATYTVMVNHTLAVPEIQSGFNPTTSSIKVAWVSVPEADSYLFDLSTNEGFSSFVPVYEDFPISGSSNTTLVINNLAANTQYYFRVKAVNASNAQMNSAYSASATASTLNPSAGIGNTEIYDNRAATINMGSYPTASQGTVSPAITIKPSGFTAISDNTISVNTGYGTSPQGLIFDLDFDNTSIINGNWLISYAGLAYHPSDVRYTFNGGPLTPIGATINQETFTVSFGLSGLSGTKGDNHLLIYFNDEKGQTLPVVLSSFTAQVLAQGRVRLNWTTQSESGVLGYHVLRGTTNDLAESLIVSSLIEGTNTSNLAHYSFIDKEIPGNGLYYYWLQSTDIDGAVAHFGPIPVELTTGDDGNNQIPKVTALNSPYPNPFNPSVNIPFDLAEKGLVKIVVYNTRGQLVKTLVNKEELPKSYSITWDGKDDSGKNVSSGSYIIKMDAGKYHSSKKVVLLK